jgi:lysophosphatidate acyltransferase
MFPEGTRNGSATLLPFKKGAFHVAISSQTPIQPVVISRYHFLDHRKKVFNSGMYRHELSLDQEPKLFFLLQT